MSRPFRSVHLDDVPEVPPDHADDVRWLPLRHHLGIGAFGTNAFPADAGQLVIERHDEVGGDKGEELDQEEMYVVVRGTARFTIDGESIDATAGTVVFIPEASAQREATALEDGTLVLAVGGPVGEPFRQSAWEQRELAKHDVPALGDA